LELQSGGSDVLLQGSLSSLQSMTLMLEFGDTLRSARESETFASMASEECL
jgi:hypothetical protein